MKKFLPVCFALGLILAACGSDTSQSNQQNNHTAAENTEENVGNQAEDEGIKVDKNLLSVEITIPESFLEVMGDFEEEADSNEEDEMEQIIEEDNGKIIENDDGSVTYKMSKSTHKKLMKEIKTEMTGAIDEIAESEDFTSIKAINANKAFNDFEVVANQEQFENSFDGFSIFGVAYGSMFYQLFDGADPDDYQVTFHYTDEETGEDFGSTTFPEALEEMEEE